MIIMQAIQSQIWQNLYNTKSDLTESLDLINITSQSSRYCVTDRIWNQRKKSADWYSLDSHQQKHSDSPEKTHK